MVRGSDRRRPLQGRENRSSEVRRHAHALLRDLRTDRRRSAETGIPARARCGAGRMSEAPFRINVRLPEPLRDGGLEIVAIDTPVRALSELLLLLESRLPGFSATNDELFN